MGLAAAHDDGVLLKNLVPLNALSDDQLGSLLSRITVERAKKGTHLFQAGSTEEQNIYLLSGNIALISDGREVDTVNSGSETARYPLAHQFPRQFSARAKTAVTFVRIDSRLLSDLLLRSQSGDIGLVETDAESGDWMSQLLQSPIFQQIPPAKQQQVMMRMEKVNASAGDVIIHQDDEGDYYYMINRGTCIVTRQPDEGAAPVKLAQLGPGNSFGEEALVSQAPRSSTVTMQSDGVLVRLGKKDFDDLFSAPLSHPLKYSEALERIEAGARWLDIRPPEDYEKQCLKDALNLPSFSLRFQTFNLASEPEYIVYGENPAFAASSAFLLLERGYRVYYLNEDLHKILKKQPATDSKVQRAKESEPGSKPGQKKVVEQHEQVKLKQLEQLLLKTKQSLTAVEEEKSAAVEAQAKVTEQLSALKSELQQAASRLTKLDAMADEHDQVLAEIKMLRTSKGELEQSFLLSEGELKERITCLQIELGEVGEASKTEQSEAIAEVEQCLQSAKQQLAQEQQTWSAERVRLESESSRLAENIKQLSEQLQQREVEGEASIAKLQQQLSESQQANGALDEQRIQLQQAQEQLSAQRLEQGEQIEALQQQLESESVRLSTLKQEHQALESAKSQQQEQINTLQQQLAELSNTGASLDEEKSELQEQILTLNNELDEANGKLDAEITAHREGRTDYQQQTEQLQHELEEGRTALASLNQQRELLEADKKARLDQIEGLQEQLSKERAARADLDQEKIAQQACIDTLSRELEQLQDHFDSEMAARQDEQVAHQQQLEQLRQELSQKQSTYATLEQQLTELSAAGVDLDQEKATQQERISALSGELTELQERLAAETTSWQNKQAEYQQQNKLLEDQLKAAAEEQDESLHAFQETIDEFVAKMDGVKTDRDQLKQQLDEQTADIDQQQEVSQTLQRVEKDLIKAQCRVTELEAADQSTQASLQSELKALHQKNERLTEQSHSEIKTIQAERDAALQKAGEFQGEVQQLRSVMEQHIDQIKLAQEGGDSVEELEALRSELEMVRLQAAHDLKKLNSDLDLARNQSAEERDPAQAALEQLLRQELDSVQEALKEKEYLLNQTAGSLRTMEDSLEERDANTDRLQLEIERLQEMLDGMLQQGAEPLSGEYIEAEADSGRDSMFTRMFKSKKGR